MSGSIISYNVSPNPNDDTETSGVPVGAINLWGGSTAPSGWLLCNGAEVSRSTYSNLFSVIGTTFGAGNGTALSISSGAVGGGGGLGYILTFSVPPYNPYIVTGDTFIINGTGTTLDGGTYTAIDTTSTTTITFIHGKSPAPGLITGVGTVTRLLPTTFTLPNTSGRTVRGVGTSSWTGLNSGTAGTTAVTLGQSAGADGTKQLADNLPPHRHAVLVPGNAMLAGGSAGGFPNVDNSSTVTIARTYANDGTTLVTNSNTVTTNAYIGINYIIKYG
jgi:microcystin-dependent protein